MIPRLLRLSVIMALLSAAPARGQQTVQQDSQATGGIPAGRGSLNQDFISIHFSVGALDIRFMPINEGIIRLLAPDGYRAISALVASQQTLIDSIAKSRGVLHPGIVMVTFNALAPNTRFDPRQFTLVLQSKRLQPIGVIPLSPTFSNHQLGAREQASGLLIFERAMLSSEACALQYLQVTNRDWELMIPRFEAERVRIIGTVKRDSIGGSIRRPL